MATLKLTCDQIQNRKGGDKLVVLTAYDYTFAKIADPLVDILLIGDSLGMVIQGNANTLSVTVDDMIYHTKAVARASAHAHVVADMPFMSYQVSAREAVRNAGRLVAEGNAESVKLEGGMRTARTVRKILDVGIPVMGHIGLTPQSVHAFGGFKVQGKTVAARHSILQDALALEDAGVYAIVLEGIPAELAREITARVAVPTIGIGAGPHCDGQVLVSQDLLGMDPQFKPRFVKQYAQLSETITEAVVQFEGEIRSGRFPDLEHSF